jgi:hypothetical protein
MSRETSTEPDSAALRQTEALRYALLLDWGTRLGVIALFLSFSCYVLGLLTPHVPLDQLPSLWGLPAKTYLERTGTPTGWGWVSLMGTGDMSNLIGVALLAACSVPLC